MDKNNFDSRSWLHRVVLDQANVTMDALCHSRKDARQICRLMIERGKDEAPAHLTVLLYGWASSWNLTSLGHHLGILVELIEGKARVLHVVGARRSTIVDVGSGHVGLIDGQVMPRRLRNHRSVHDLEILCRALIQVDGI